MTEELPEGWATVRLADVGQWYGGGTPSKSKSEFWDNGVIPWISPKDMRQEVLHEVQDRITEEAVASSPVRLVPEKSVVFVVRSGVLERRFPVALTVAESTLNQDMKAIHPYEGVDSRWIVWCLRWMEQSILRDCRKSGTTVASLESARIKEVEIPLPPLAEQLRIVEHLESKISFVRSVVGDAERAQSKIEKFKNSVLDASVRGGFDVSSPGRGTDDVAPGQGDENSFSGDVKRKGFRRKGHVSPRVLEGYELPQGWKMPSLSDLSYDFGYGTSAKCSPDASGVGVLRIPNVVNGEISLKSMKYVLDESLDLSSLYLESSDLIFVRTNGSRSLIGRCALVRERTDFAFASYLIRFRLDLDIRDSEWVQLVLESPLWRKIIESEAASSAGQYNIGSKFLASLPIPIPPGDELVGLKSSIYEMFGKADRVKSALDDVLRRSDALNRSLLAAAFSGKLVPQDPSDEPASQLLSRIRAEQAAVTKPKRGRRAKTSESPKNPVPVPKESRPVPAGEQTALEI